jgi:P-type Cu+ transporter
MNENHSENSHHDQGGEHHQHKHEHGKRGSAVTMLVGKYTCPMHPEVVSDKPGDCPKCGMALEPMAATLPETIYTCPMHPEIEQDHPGDCPICGMALERKTLGAEDGAEHAEIRSLSRKFWIGLAFTVPVLFIAMGHLIPGLHIER